MASDITFQSEIAHWTWTIAFFLWFIGLGGMTSIAYYWVRKAAVSYAILVSIIVGLLFVVSHLARWWNLPIVVWTMLINLHLNYTSWMFIGVCVLSVHLVMAAILALSHMEFILRRIPFLGFLRHVRGEHIVGNAFCVLFGIVGFVSVIYSGFLLTAAVGVPFWGTALIPVLWVLSGGIAAIALLELLYVFGYVDERVSLFGMKLGLGIDALKLFAIFSLLHVAVTLGSQGARISAEQMIWGDLALMTWGGVIGLGILVPMALSGYMLSAGKNKALIAVSAVSALAGVLLLRAAVLLAGVWEPLA